MTRLLITLGRFKNLLYKADAWLANETFNMDESVAFIF
jgi:hypothetical protein